MVVPADENVAMKKTGAVRNLKVFEKRLKEEAFRKVY
jgi:hypothetical protein